MMFNNNKKRIAFWFFCLEGQGLCVLQLSMGTTILTSYLQSVDLPLVSYLAHFLLSVYLFDVVGQESHCSNVFCRPFGDMKKGTDVVESIMFIQRQESVFWIHLENMGKGGYAFLSWLLQYILQLVSKSSIWFLMKAFFAFFLELVTFNPAQTWHWPQPLPNSCLASAVLDIKPRVVVSRVFLLASPCPWPALGNLPPGSSQLKLT